MRLRGSLWLTGTKTETLGTLDENDTIHPNDAQLNQTADIDLNNILKLVPAELVAPFIIGSEENSAEIRATWTFCLVHPLLAVLYAVARRGYASESIYTGMVSRGQLVGDYRIGRGIPYLGTRGEHSASDIPISGSESCRVSGLIVRYRGTALCVGGCD